MHGMNDVHVHIYTGLWFWQCFSMASIRRAVLWWHSMGSSIPCVFLYLFRRVPREAGHPLLQMARSSVAWRSLHWSNVLFCVCWVMAVFHPATQKI